ncbi:MAG: (2Fe-2S)-binding protein [Acidobacteriaceae bacterium]|nr:(2Fe-2S)-binding protein [Acidobacteriaceae bacterium]
MASKAEAAEEIRFGAAVQVSVEVEVNGRLQAMTLPSDMRLVDFLRDRLGLTGTKFGCDTGQCGSCTILLDDVSVKSCTMLAVQADGARITTIEGVSTNGSLTALQNAFWEQHAVQCGYCTPGLILSLTDLLNRNPHPSESEIRRWIDGNICRCGVYQNVVRAVESITAQAE